MKRRRIQTGCLAGRVWITDYRASQSGNTWREPTRRPCFTQASQSRLNRPTMTGDTIGAVAAFSLQIYIWGERWKWGLLRRMPLVSTIYTEMPVSGRWTVITAITMGRPKTAGRGVPEIAPGVSCVAAPGRINRWIFVLPAVTRMCPTSAPPRSAFELCERSRSEFRSHFRNHQSGRPLLSTPRGKVAAGSPAHLRKVRNHAHQAR